MKECGFKEREVGMEFLLKDAEIILRGIGSMI
jgi:hypothetical protein